MSELLRLAVVSEGPTDTVVIQAAVSSLLGDQRFVLNQLQPEESLAFGPTGAGWSGVYRWCRQAADQSGGRLRDNTLFSIHDALVLGIDADVGDKTYQSASIVESVQDLPCSRPCPPPFDTTDLLRLVLLRWFGESAVPPRIVLCTPSKSIEAWVLAALFPSDPIVRLGNLECRPEVETLLAGKPLEKRLVRAGKKILEKYREHAPAIERAWPSVCRLCTEADRFSNDFLTGISTPP